MNYETYYKDLVVNGDLKGVVKRLIVNAPTCVTELKTFEAHVYSIESQKIRGVISAENFDVANSKIVQAILVFLDEYGAGNVAEACRSLLIGDEDRSAFDNIIESQLEFSQKAVKENKVFRIAVSVIFLAAVAFSVIVTYNHIDFLRDKVDIIALVSLNILLYVCIGLLALYALTLIIKGSLYNQWFLKFSKKSVKNRA